jgi:hypothetical protein
MLDVTHRCDVLLAWIEPPPFRDLDARTEDEPDLQLLVVADRGTTLFVEIAEGIPCPRGTWLWVEERGSFEVTGVLSRCGQTGSRTYMRLQSATFPAAA